MNEQTIKQANEVSFKEFLLKNKRNRAILIWSGVAVVIQFAVFKYLYPYANYIHDDSFSYINAAYKNLDINTYLIGYSRFLRLFSVFTRSDTALVAFQYLFIQTSMFSLLFTTFYFYNPGKGTQYILLIFMVFNPLFLHLANLISSDCLFASLSLTWFTLLLWLIHSPNTQVIIWQAGVLFVAFTVRYNALMYPFITAGAFWLSPLSIRRKLVGFCYGLLPCLLFVTYTSYKYKELTGYWQYSPFSGWQMANNAMYAYRYVDSTNRKAVPKKFQPLDNMIREYFDSTRDIKKFPIEAIQASTVYMWTQKLSLFKYRDQLFDRIDSSAGEFKRWSSMGPLFREYGSYIIRKYPWHFLRYFIWPNGNKYYAPPVEFLSIYNGNLSDVKPQTQEWFQYHSTKIKTRLKSNKVLVLSFYPILSGIINVIMLFTLLFYLFSKGWQTNRVAKYGILMSSAVWLLNAAFTISASSAALRFQSFPILLSTTFATLLLDWLWKTAMYSEMEIPQPKINNRSQQIATEIIR